MFTYAMIVGVKKGWLDAKEYGEVARKGWIALCSYIDKAGDVKAVCEGTMIKNSREHYINRLALTGDLHGQAPVLWCAYALVTDFKTNKYHILFPDNSCFVHTGTGPHGRRATSLVRKTGCD